MTKDDLSEYVRQILSYLKSDIEAYEKARKKGVTIGAGSYLLSASSGIDFLGSLAVPEEELSPSERKGKELKRMGKKGSMWYIKNYLKEINPKYGNTDVSKFVYIALRCGQVHEGIVKRGVLIGTKYPQYHLSILEIRESNDEPTTITPAYVDTRILAQDFIHSTDLFVNNLVNQDQPASKLADRLSKHLSATKEPSTYVDLPRHQLDKDTFVDIYDFSSCSPHDQGTRYRLKSHYWENL